MTSQKTWEEFAEYIRALHKAQKAGRRSLRRDWAALRELFDREVRPRLTTEEIVGLLGKQLHELDPEENDLKALVAHAIGRGLVRPERLRDALQADDQTSPMFFLAGLSGKAFGEVVAPLLCRFWLDDGSDGWDKRPGTDFYDVGWTPFGATKVLRLEIKASSESPAYRFQQVRRPKTAGSIYSYDALLCVGVTAKQLEFWLVPAPTVGAFIDDGVFEKQHGGKKVGLESNTYWFTMTDTIRWMLRDYHVTPGELRDSAIALLGN